MKKESGLLLILLAALSSGFAIFINKFGVKLSDPYIFTFSKNILAVLFLFSIILLTKNFSKIKSLNLKQWFKLILIGLIGGSIPFLLFFKGLSITTATKSAFIHKTMFIFISILAILFLKERLTKKLIIASIILIIGNIFLLRFTWQSLNTGDLLILLATLLWAGEITLSKHTLKKIPSEIVTFGRMFFGIIFISIFLLITNQLVLITTLTMKQISWVLITSLFLVFYLTVFYKGLKRIPAITASIILLISPIITTFLNLTTGSTITLTQSFGIFLLLIGIATIIGLKQTIKTLTFWKSYART